MNTTANMTITFKGGPGSGHKGHVGRLCKRGGSLPGTGVQSFRSFNKSELDRMISAMRDCTGNTGDQWLDSTGDPWLDHFIDLDPSMSERNALYDYTGTMYSLTNRTLRRGKTSFDSGDTNERYANIVRQMDNLLDRSTVPEDVITYRGTDSKDWSNKLKVGDIYVDDGIVSTSISKSVAKNFGGLTGTMVEIEVPKGSHGFYIPSLIHPVFGDLVNEHELVLPRGSMFQVVSNTAKRSVTLSGEFYTSNVLRVRYIGTTLQKPVEDIF